MSIRSFDVERSIILEEIVDEIPKGFKSDPIFYNSSSLIT